MLCVDCETHMVEKHKVGANWEISMDKQNNEWKLGQRNNYALGRVRANLTLLIAFSVTIMMVILILFYKSLIKRSKKV